MACGACIKKMANNKSRTQRLNKISKKNKVCKYSKEDLINLLEEVKVEFHKSIIRSQINIYFTNCKAFQNKIDEIKQSLK